MPDAVQISADEADRLSRYLIGRSCPEEIENRYRDAVHKLNATLNPVEQKIWNRMMASGIYLKLVDSGLAVASPQSPLRKRIFIMLALLETNTNFTEFFLPQPRNLFYLVPLGFRTGLSALYLIAGMIVVKVSKIR